jgi:predicted lipoprotein with Yx(FWY)xxD motif
MLLALPAAPTRRSSPPNPSGQTGTDTPDTKAHQLTYDGHPLYTYIGDTAPGQARGNNLNLNGGLWHEVPASR